MFRTSFGSGLLSQREFSLMSLSQRDFLTSLLPYKTCNQFQFLSLVTVYLLTTCNHYYYCKCFILLSITSIFKFYVHYTTCCYHHLGQITTILEGSKLLSFTLIILAIPSTWLSLLATWLVLQHCIYVFSYLHYFQLILLLFNCASVSNAVSLPPLWYQSHSFLAGDSGVVFSVSLSVSTRNFSTLLLCSLLTVVGATLVIK